jgi:hypothetical protein
VVQEIRVGVLRLSGIHEDKTGGTFCGPRKNLGSFASGAANCLWKRSRLLYWLTPVMRNAGVGLLIAAYVLYTSLGAMLAEYAAPWPTALANALALNGLVLASFPFAAAKSGPSGSPS